jgi:hypothetical protein
MHSRHQMRISVYMFFSGVRYTNTYSNNKKTKKQRMKHRISQPYSQTQHSNLTAKPSIPTLQTNPASSFTLKSIFAFFPILLGFFTLKFLYYTFCQFNVFKFELKCINFVRNTDYWADETLGTNNPSAVASTQ